MNNCPYCGKSVKETDRFCITCGEPLLHEEEDEEEDQKTSQASAASTKSTKDGKKDRLALFKGRDAPPVEDKDADEDTAEAGDEDEEITVDVSSDIGSSSSLEPEIKEHIEACIEMYFLGKAIKKYKRRLDESLKLMEDEDFRRRFDYDDEFHKQNSIRLEVLKQLGNELRTKKAELEAKIKENFILQEQNSRIATLKAQITELINSFKLRRIDRKTYDALHSEYKIELTKLLKDREIANIKLNAWISSLKTKRADIKHRISVSKGRKASKEITKEQLKEEREEFEREIKKIDEKIKVIQTFILTD